MRALRTLALAIAVMTGFPAVAQQFPTVPDRSVIGRIGTGSGSGPSQAIPFGTFTASAGIAVSPSAFKAAGDGVTDDHVALQNWANSLRDGGVGSCNSALGYATSQTIVFTPSTNTAPVQGPVILGNCKFIGLSGLTSDLLRIWNPTAVTTSQNFYYPRFEALTLSNPNGSSAHCLSLRGFWGSIGQIFGTNCGGDVVNFPAYALGGISDEYESMATFGSVTGIGTGGAIIGNDMGSGASYTAGDVRGNTNTTLTAGTGLLRGTGSMSQSGALVYTGGGYAIQYVLPVAPAVVTPAHEVYSEGWGDLDCIQNGMKFEALRVGIISGHRMNIEPASGGACNTGTVIPQTAYSFGRTDQTGDVENLVVNAFVTVRPGVTFPAFTLIDFNNETNITNLTVNLSINDQTGTLAAQSFSTLYKNIHPSATVRIVQNGVVVYDTITNAVYLNPSAGFQTKLLPAPTANFTMMFPSTAGASGSFLQSVGGGTTPMTWLAPGSGVATAMALGINAAGGVVTSPVANANLANSTISGVSLGSNLLALTFGTHLASGGTTYNGSAGVTITSDATAANTASTIMARDGSGQVAATTFTGALAGNATTATSAGSATTATNSGITNDTSTNATMFPVWVTANTGNLPLKVTSTKVTFNPSTGNFASTMFNGLTVTANGTNTLNIAAGKTLTDTSGAGATLLLGTTGGGFTSYGGVNCTNQFLTGLGSAGASVCASVPTNTPIFMGNAFSFVNSGNTAFYGVNSSTTEAVVSQPAGQAMTLKNCYASVSAAAGAGNTWTYTLRQNGSNTALTWTVSGASQVLGSDLTHTVALAATDLWDIQVVASATVTASVSHKITCTAVTTSP